MEELDDGRITILFNHDGLKIELYDYKAHIAFATAELTPEEVVKAFSRLGYTPCKIGTNNLKNVGKILETKTLEFEIPEELRWRHSQKNEGKLILLAEKAKPKGWHVRHYFRSQDSFFTKDGKTFARTTISRWVKK